VRRCSRYQTAIKRNAVTLLAMLALLGAGACAGPPQNLSDPAKFRTIENALRTDLTKVDLDLQLEAHDAYAGASGKRESPCYNLKNNINFVVIEAIRQFVMATVTSDHNINQMRSDRSGFEADIFDFINDGVARPAGANRAIAEITTKIILARANANRIISAVNNDVRMAYDIANDLASGRCIGDGPGTQMPQVLPLT
jgi:hypothetical protein